LCFVLQWQDVLDIIAKALYDNNMTFSQINGISKFQVHKGYFSLGYFSGRKLQVTETNLILLLHCFISETERAGNVFSRIFYLQMIYSKNCFYQKPQLTAFGDKNSKFSSEK